MHLQKYKGQRLKKLLRQELPEIVRQPDKVTANAIAIAQLIWSQKELVDSEIGAFAYIGDDTPPGEGSIVPFSSEKGRKSKRPEVGGDEKKAFAGFIFNYFNYFLSTLFLSSKISLL